MKTLPSTSFVFVVLCLVLILAALGHKTGDAGSDTGNPRICAAPSTNTIEGDISPGSLQFAQTAKMPTDDDEKYAAFLERALPRLQKRDAEIEPDYYVTFAVFFRFNKGGARQLAAAVICEKKFGAADNKCRNRTYLSFSHYEPDVLADVIAADILKSQPTVRDCRSPS